MFEISDAKLFKDAFEEAQRILEQNQNTLEDESDSESDTESEDSQDTDEEENKAAANTESQSDKDVIEKLSELKVVGTSEQKG